MSHRALILSALIALAAPAWSASERADWFSIKQETADVGSSLKRELVRGPFPPDHRWADLEPAQVAALKAEFDGMAATDEPPFPARGLRAVYEGFAKAQEYWRVNGMLVAYVTVDSQGQARKVEVVKSPSQAMTDLAAKMLMLETFKPAQCAGKPCVMEFPVRVEFLPMPAAPRRRTNTD